MSEVHQQAMLLQNAGDVDVGISPVLLQAVNQTLDLNKVPNEQVIEMVTDEETIVNDDSELNESQTIVIESTDETISHPTLLSDDTVMATTSNKNSSGHLVIRVIGDNFGDAVNQAAIMKQLREKLGIKVVVQMENTQGNVIFEDTVTPNKQNEGEIDVSDNSLLGDKENEDVNNIVKSVVNTIRDLSSKLSVGDSKPCPVCGDVITGYHYGVQTCESCKGFFKRTVQNKKTHTCHRGGTCEINLQTRKKCGACRFQKCCEVGMKVEGIREDRSRGGRSSYDGASYAFQKRQNILASNDAISPVAKKPRLSDILAKPSYVQPVIPPLMQTILALEPLFDESSDSPAACCLDKLTISDKQKFNSMLHITEHRLYQIVKWARNTPNFLSICTEDQILLLQNSWAELISLGAIWRSRFSPGVVQLTYGKTIDLQKAREMEHEEVISRMLHVCTNLRRLQVDKYEYVTLKALALMVPDIKGLKDVNVIQQYQSKLIDALLLYTSTHYPNMPTKFGELLLRLSEVQRYTAVTRKQIAERVKATEITEYGLLMELIHGKRGSLLTAVNESLNQPMEIISVQDNIQIINVDSSTSGDNVNVVAE